MESRGADISAVDACAGYCKTDTYADYSKMVKDRSTSEFFLRNGEEEMEK